MPEERKTKLVCNLNMDDFFTYPNEEGTWRTTRETRTISRKKHYLCRQVVGKKQLLILGSERVELTDKVV